MLAGKPCQLCDSILAFMPPKTKSTRQGMGDTHRFRLLRYQRQRFRRQIGII